MKTQHKLAGLAAGILAFIAIFSISACNNAPSNATAEETPAVEETTETTDPSIPKLTDAEIASIVVTANQIDVNYGKIALEKGSNSTVKNFAETMIKDHQSIIEQSVALVEKLGVTPMDNAVSQSLLEGEKGVTATLQAASGADFDKAYIDNEVAYHEAVISTVKEVILPQTQNAELKDALVKVMPLLEHHLEMARMAQAAL